MVCVRSDSTSMSIADGRLARRLGIKASMLSTTSMMLAPGWRWMLRITARSWFFHAAWRRFSASSITSATSDRRTAAPSRWATISAA